MNSTTPPEPPPGSLLDIARENLQALYSIHALLAQSLARQKNLEARVEALQQLLIGYTNDGASFLSHQVDPMTSAYLAILGPLCAHKLIQHDPDLTEMMKGGTVLARQLLEELDAYRSTRAGLDYLEEQAAFINDPWAAQEQGQESES